MNRSSPWPPARRGMPSWTRTGGRARVPHPARSAHHRSRTRCARAAGPPPSRRTPDGTRARCLICVRSRCAEARPHHAHEDVEVMTELIVNNSLRALADVRVGVGLPANELQANAPIRHERADRGVQLRNHGGELASLVVEVTGRGHEDADRAIWRTHG